MNSSDKQNVETAAQSLLDASPHYVDSVSEISESHVLCATDDIVSASGIKLVARGSQIDKRLIEKLSDHRLSSTQLERNISIRGGVTTESLALDTARLIDDEAWFKVLAAKSGDPVDMRHGLSRLKLPDEILFRLTVAREKRPELYHHSLVVSIISQYLALRLKLKQAVIDKLLIAALCHDLGELYTNPAILEPGHQITEDERRFIYVHPITGWLIVRNLPGLDPDIAKAIIQHQERLDGSGYPNGLKEDAIGQIGRILAAADISASIMVRFRDHRRLSTLLRLNSKKYDRQLIDLLHEAILAETPSTAQLERQELTNRFSGLAKLLDAWSHLRANPETAETAPVIFLTERMYNLRTVVLSFGFDPDSFEVPLELAEEDAEIAAELAAVIDELQFQLKELRLEIDRHSASWAETLDPLAFAALNQWLDLGRSASARKP